MRRFIGRAVLAAEIAGHVLPADGERLWREVLANGQRRRAVRTSSDQKDRSTI